MKKLQKLNLTELNEISNPLLDREMGGLMGGGEWVLFNGEMTYMIDEVTVNPTWDALPDGTMLYETAIDNTYVAQMGSDYYSFKLDDTGVPVGSGSPGVITMGEWGLIGTGATLGMAFGFIGGGGNPGTALAGGLTMGGLGVYTALKN